MRDRRRAGSHVLVTAALVAVAALVGFAVMPARPAAAGGGGFTPAAIHTDFFGAVLVRERGRIDRHEFRGSADINLSFPDLSLRLLFDIPSEGMGELVLVDNTLFLREGEGRWDALPLGDLGLDRSLFAVPGMSAVARPTTSVDEALRELDQLGLPTRRLADEVIRGQRVNHIVIEMGPAELARMLETVAPTFGPAGMPAPSTEEIIRELGEFRFTFDLWLDVNDGFPYRLAMKMDTGEDGEGFEVDRRQRAK
ncbi:MAG: hypothetical protein U0531_08330 [Dehalococcoidia bacterium]